MSGRTSTKRRSAAELAVAVRQLPPEAPQPALLPALIVERRRMLEARLRLVQADTTPIRTSTRVEEGYSCPELSDPAVRLGRMTIWGCRRGGGIGCITGMAAARLCKLNFKTY